MASRYKVAFLLLLALSWLGAVQKVYSSPVSQFSYKTVRSTDAPTGMDSYGQPQFVRSVMQCTMLCARDPLCKAVYMNEIDRTKSPQCHLYSQTVADFRLLSPGTGTYAYFTTFYTTDSPQTFIFGSLQYTTWYEPAQTIVAVYSIPVISMWTSLGVLFDRELHQFPKLSSLCAQTLYTAVGLSSTIVRIVEEVPGSFYRLEVTCQDGETKLGDATCDSLGGWDIGGNVGMACISNDCYRIDGAGYARYSGTVQHTQYGTGCSDWNRYYYSDSKFPEDNYNKDQAQNYCRDPDGSSVPWCRIGYYYDYCTVSKCNWQP